MAVHMLGNPCNLDALQAIAAKHKLILIEDAAQAFGGSYKGRRLGTIGKIGHLLLQHLQDHQRRRRRHGGHG